MPGAPLHVIRGNGPAESEVSRRGSGGAEPVPSESIAEWRAILAWGDEGLDATTARRIIDDLEVVQGNLERTRRRVTELAADVERLADDLARCDRTAMTSVEARALVARLRAIATST